MNPKKRRKRNQISSTSGTSETDGEARDWNDLLDTIQSHLAQYPLPSVTTLSREPHTPFQILVSTIISLRTRDEVTLARSRALFAECPDAASVRACDPEHLQNLLYPAGFYRTKADNIREISRIILEDYDGEVPNTPEGLLGLPGVGRKTANLVLSLGFGIPAICVDIHVHRIPNRLGLVHTKKPEDTETALRALVPEQRWIQVNELLVAFGQTVCTPRSPHCSKCPFTAWCPRIGVSHSR